MLTVLFATCNRASILERVLQSYCKLQIPESGWKVVVVDNGSSDRTSEVLASFSSRLPLQAVSEPAPGKNRALNAGMRFIDGDLIVLTDDDVFPPSDWLIKLRATADAHPAYSVFGGMVLPLWEIPPPHWIQWVQIGPAFGLNNTSIEDGPVAEPMLSNIIGPNMMVRSSIFRSGVRFDPSIGPNGISYPMGSETELVRRLYREGNKAWWVKSVVVEHLVRKEQIDKAWILRRAIRLGRGRHRMTPNPRQWLGIPRYLFRDIPKEAVNILAATLLLNPGARFRAQWRFNDLFGEGYEAFLAIRQRKTRNHASIQ